MLPNPSKVVHFTTAHSAFDVRIFKKECTSLSQAGYKVTLIAPGEGQPHENGVHIRFFPKPHGRIMRSTLAVWRAYRVAARERADLFHFHDLELVPAGLLLAMRGRRVVYDAHENWATALLHREWIPARLRKIVSWSIESAEKFAARHMSGVVAAANDIEETFRGIEVPIVCVRNYPLLEEFPRNGANTSRFTSGLGVNFGGISNERVIREIVQAAGLLPRELKFRLIVGGLPDVSGLLEEVTQVPGWEKIEYVQAVGREQMIETMHKAGLALILYSPSPNHFAVRSNRLFEALASGLPVVTSNFPEWQKLIHEAKCGLTVNPENPAEIADAIRYLLNNPAEAAAMGQRGRLLFEQKFNWKSEETALLQLYQQLLVA